MRAGSAAAELRWSYGLAVTGKTAAAREILERYARKREATSSFDLAATCAALGEHDRAFQFFEHALAVRHIDLWYLRVDPRFDPLRNDPRFKELLKRIGLAS